MDPIHDDTIEDTDDIDENLDIPDDNDDETQNDYFKTPSETIQTNTKTQVKELKRQKINQLAQHLGVTDFDENLIDYDRIRLRNKNGVIVVEFLKKNGFWSNLTSLRSGRFLADSALLTIFGGQSGVKNFFLIDSINESRFKRTISAARKLNMELPTNDEVESIPLEDLRNRSSEIQSSIHEAEKATGLPLRELKGLDEALQKIQTQLTLNVAKLDEVNNKLQHESDKLETMEANPNDFSDDIRDRIRKKVADLKVEKDARLEIISQHRKDLQTQISRIRQTIEKVLDSDTTLGDKIRTIFREQGITIAAVLTAFGLLISTIVGFVTGGGGSTNVIKPPKKGLDPKKWLQNNLKALARLMGKLAQKLGAALPGIIGSIVSWLLNRFKDVFSFAAEHVYIFLIFIGSGLFTAISSSKINK